MDLCLWTYVYGLMFMDLCLWTYVYGLMFMDLCLWTYVYGLTDYVDNAKYEARVGIHREKTATLVVRWTSSAPDELVHLLNRSLLKANIVIVVIFSIIL